MSLSKRGKEVLLVPPLNSLGFFHFLKFFAKKRRKGKKEKKKKRKKNFCIQKKEHLNLDFLPPLYFWIIWINFSGMGSLCFQYLALVFFLSIELGEAFNPVAHTWTNTYIPSGSLGYTFHWHYDAPSGSMYFKLTAPTTGWVGLGLAEAGGMRGADLMVASVDDSDLSTLTVGDYYALSESMPSADCQSDWVGHWGTQDDSSTTIIVSRALETNDLQDRPIKNDGDPTRFIVAYSPYGLDMLSYHGTSRHSFKLNLFESEGVIDHTQSDQRLDAIKNDPNVRTFTVLNNNYNLPNIKTDYKSVKGEMPDMSEESYILAFEALIEPENRDYVHHFTLFGCETTNKNNCQEQNLLWAWASGILGTAFPEGIGIRLGANGYRTFSMQTHYDNPNYSGSIVDSSGVIVYYTTEPQQYDLGVFQIGDGRLTMMNQYLPAGLSHSTMECPGSCTNGFSSPTTFNILDVALHMHQVGEASSLKHIRDGVVINEAVTEWYR